MRKLSVLLTTQGQKFFVLSVSFVCVCTSFLSFSLQFCIFFLDLGLYSHVWSQEWCTMCVPILVRLVSVFCTVIFSFPFFIYKNFVFQTYCMYHLLCSVRGRRNLWDVCIYIIWNYFLSNTLPVKINVCATLHYLRCQVLIQVDGTRLKPTGNQRQLTL